MLLLCALAITVIVGSRMLSRPAVIARVCALIERSWHCRCSIARIDATAWGGVAASGVEIRTAIDRGCTLSVSLPRVDVAFHPLLLLTYLAQRHAERSPATPAAAADRAVRAPPIFVAVKQLEFSRASLLLRDNKAATFAASTITAQLTFAKSGASGTIGAGRLQFADQWTIDRLTTGIEATDSGWRFDKCRGDFLGGAFDASGVIDPGEKRLRACAVRLTDADVGKLYAAARGQGAMAGKARIAVKLQGPYVSLDSLSGSGSLQVKNMTVRDLPAQKSLVLALFLPKLTTAQFSGITADFEFSRGRITTRNLVGAGDPLSFASAGWVDADGRVDHRLKGTLTSALARDLPRAALNSLDDAPNGGKSFLCRIHGTLADPSVQLDRALVNRAISNALLEVQQEIQRYVR